MPPRRRFLPAFALALTVLSAPAASAAEPAVAPDFRLLDQDGRSRRLYDQRAAKAVVLYSFGEGCPISRKDWPQLRQLKERFASRGVVLWFLDSMPQDDAAALSEAVHGLGIDVPLLPDRSQLIADRLGLSRTGEALLIDPRGWRIVYRGAVDDRHDYGASRPAAGRGQLSDAVEDLLAGRAPRVARTEALGCLFKPATAPSPDYAAVVVPIVARRCLACHDGTGAGPVFDGHAKLKGWGPMILETIATGRMPPAGPDPAHGLFKDEAPLTHEEVRALADWFAAGAPAGAPGAADPLADARTPAPPAPDLTFRVLLPSATVAGREDYLWTPLADALAADIRVRGIDVRGPGRVAVHHISVASFPRSFRSPVSRCDKALRGGGFLKFLAGQEVAGWGKGMLQLAPETFGFTARRGETLSAEIHFETSRVARTLEIRVYLAGEGSRELERVIIPNNGLRIPPHAREYEVQSSTRTQHALLLHGLFAHMHHRGARMRIRARPPGEPWRTLLSLPWYQMDWQRRYWLEEPLVFPAGTEIAADGAYDNSARNRLNPDPSREVRVGLCSGDEMFVPVLFVTPL